MYALPEQLISFNKANLEMALKFAGVALEGTERLLDLQMRAAKSALADGIQSARALASARDVEYLAEGAPQGTHTVILRFRDADEARRVYRSAEYRPHRDARLAATVPRFAMIVPTAD